MTILWLDGFDTYNPTDPDSEFMYQGAYQNGGGCNVQTNATYVRTGNASLNFGGGGVYRGFIARNIGSLQKCWSGAAFYVVGGNSGYLGGIGFSTPTIGNPFASGNPRGSAITAGILSTGNIQVSAAYQSDGSPVILATSTTSPISFNAYNYIEIYADITDGIFDVYVNGVQVMSVTGINYTSYGITELNYGILGMYYNGLNVFPVYADDYYINDDTQMGAQRCYTLFPSGDEPGNQWSLSGGATGYSLINNPAYNTANYIQGENVGDESSFSMQSIGIGNAIVNGVRLTSIQELATAGTGAAEMSAVIGSNTVTSQASAPGATPSTFDACFNLTNVSIAQVNAMVATMTKTG